MRPTRQSFAGSVLLRNAARPAGNARTTERDFIHLLRRYIMNELVMSARNFLREEDGVTAIEYGLLAALIAVAIIVGANALGTNLNALFTAIAGCLTALPAPCAP